jgi:hypothetical protein
VLGLRGRRVPELGMAVLRRLGGVEMLEIRALRDGGRQRQDARAAADAGLADQLVAWSRALLLRAVSSVAVSVVARPSARSRAGSVRGESVPQLSATADPELREDAVEVGADRAW